MMPSMDIYIQTHSTKKKTDGLTNMRAEDNPDKRVSVKGIKGPHVGVSEKASCRGGAVPCFLITERRHPSCHAELCVSNNDA